MKINFDKIEVYTDLSKTHAVIQDMRKDFANFIYTQGHGIEDHALALKIYNGTGEQECDDKEYQLLMNYANQMCTPKVIDALASYKEQ